MIFRETELEDDLNKQLEYISGLHKNNDIDLHTEHNVVCGDFLKLNLDRKFNLIFTSPPYNAGLDYDNYDDSKPVDEYVEFLYEFLDKADELLLEGGRLVINIRDIGISKGNRFPIIIPFWESLCLGKKYKYRNLHIWYKGREESSTAWGSWLKSVNPAVIDLYEYLFVFQKGEYPKGVDNLKKEEFIESVLGVWKIRPVKKIVGKAKENTMGHPCPFPVELPLRVIKLYSHVGDYVLDPFAGIGTTSVAAFMASRNSVSVDLSQSYCDKALARLKECKCRQ